MSVPAGFDYDNAEVRIDWFALSNDPAFDDPQQGTTDCDSRVSGSTSQVLSFDPVLLPDAGVYTVTYTDGETDVISFPFTLSVVEDVDMPVAGVAGLLLLGAAALGAGVSLQRRKR